MKLDSAQ